MTARGKKRKLSPRDGVFYVDNKPVDLAPWQRHALKNVTLNKSHGVTLINQGTEWLASAECLQNDDVLTALINEFITAFDVKFSMDWAISEIICDLSASDAARALAHAVSRRVVTDDIVCHLTDTYRRYFLWSIMLGGAPVSYIHAKDVNFANADAKDSVTYTRQQAVNRAMTDNDAFNAFCNALTNGERVAKAIDRLGKTTNWIKRDLVSKLNDLKDDNSEQLIITTIEIIKRFRDGHFPHIPRLDDDHVMVLYEHATRRCLVIDRYQRSYEEFYWILEEPLTDLKDVVKYRSVLSDGSEESFTFRHMKTEFYKAVLTNSKRSIVVTPSDGSAESDKQRDILREYFMTLSEKYPHQFYNDMIRQNRSADDRLRMEVAAAAVPPGVVNLTTNTCDILESYEDHTRRKILSDLRTMIGNYETSDRAYADLKAFIDAYGNNNMSQMKLTFAKLIGEDKERVHDLFSQKVSAPTDKPTIHRLERNYKLISMYTATVGIAEVEELSHMWYIMWKTRLSSISMYTRRKNFIQYTGTNNKESMVYGSRLVLMKFCAIVNTDIVILKEPKEQSVQLTTNDIFILDKVINKTTGLRAVVAKHMSMTPSELSFKDNPEANEQDMLEAIALGKRKTLTNIGASSSFTPMPGISNEINTMKRYLCRVFIVVSQSPP